MRSIITIPVSLGSDLRSIMADTPLSKEWQAETVHLTDGKLVSRVEIDNGGRFYVFAHCRADFLVILVTAEFAELILVDVLSNDAEVPSTIGQLQIGTH